MSIANILAVAIFIILTIELTITIIFISKLLKETESLSGKQCNILMILINARVKNEESFKTLEKIEKVLVPDWQSKTNTNK